MKKITDKNEAIEAVEQDGMKLEECSDELRNDRNVVITAVTNREKAMMFVSEELQCDEAVIQSALIRRKTLRSERGIAFSFVPEHIRDNEEMALIAITSFGGAFQYFSNRLKNDEAFLIRAATKNYEVFSFLDNKYARDKTFIQKVLDDTSVLRFQNTSDFARVLEATILDDKPMMKMILKKAGYENFKYASDRLKKDRSYITEILSVTPQVYEFLNNFYDDKEMTMHAVQGDGMNLRCASWRLKEDKEVVFAAVKNNPHSIQFSDDSLQKDEALLSYVTKDDSYYWNIIDACTGNRYGIPMLSTLDGGYYWKYISYMKQKEQSPNTFDAMLRWD